MAKNLRLLFLTLLCAVFNVSMAETITFSDLGYENAQDVTVVEGSHVTLTFDQGTGKNAPKYYTNGTNVRMYAGNTLTVESEKDIASVVFNCSSGNEINQNYEFSAGSYENGTWTGPAKSFVLTNTAESGNQFRFVSITVNYADGTVDKINPGLHVADVTITEGEEKELEVTTKSDGAITFLSDDLDVADVIVNGTTYTLSANGVGTCTITVTQAETDDYLPGSTTFNVTVKEYVAPGTYPTVQVPFTVNFQNEDGQFVFEDVVNNLGTDVWKRGSQYGWTATAYVGGSNHDAESWLVSPIIDLTSSSTATLQLTDQVNKYFGDIDTEITINVREAGATTWTNLNVAHEKPASGFGGWKDQTVDLAAYAGKKIQIGFHYIGTATTSGTYEVKSFSVTAEQVVQKTDPELSYTVEGNAVEEFTAYLNEENTFPVLNNPYSVPVTYKSQNEDIATIDADGNITLKDKEGNTDITATFEGNETYNGAEVKYTLHVRERAVAGTDVYTLVTSTDDLVDGDEIIIVNEANTYAIAKHAGTNNRPAESVELEDDGTIIPSSAIAKITLKGEEDAWNFYVHTGDGQGYLYAASTSANQLKTQENVDEKATATITIDDNSVANVVFQNSASGARNHLRYNESSQLFSCYAESSNVTGLVRIYKMADDKEPAGLAYSANEFTYTIGGENEEFPTLSNPNQLPVTYSSSVESVATIDADGNITIVAAGETTITASTDGDATHRAGEASYTLTVEEGEVPFVEVTYELVNNAKTLKPGDKIILVNAEKTYAMSTDQAKNNRRGAEVTPNEDGTITPDENVEVITLGGEEGAWTLAVSGGYLYAPGGGNYLRTQADPADVTIDINDEAGAEITFAGEIEQNSLRFNQNGSNEYRLFSCYKATSDLPFARIYREVRDYEEVEITAAGYATMYYGYKNLEVPAGVTAKTYKADANGLSESKTYAAGSVIPAGTAVVLEGNEGMYTFNVTEEEGTADANNMLLGFDEPTLTVGPNETDTYLFYILSTDKNGENVGFYFKEDGGAAFTSEAHKAYLAVPSEVATSFYSFDSGSDGINNVVTNVNANDDVYSLSGVRMNGKLNKGIYIKNGKKVVIK